MILIALTLSCSSGPPDVTEEVLEDYEAAVMGIHDTVDAFAVDVAATEWDGHAALHSDYDTEIDHAFEDLEHVLGELAGCEGDAQDALSDADSSLEAMHGFVEALALAHADHTTVDECIEAAEAHELEMDEEIDSLESHHDTLHDAMHCAAHDEDADEGDGHAD